MKMTYKTLTTLRPWMLCLGIAVAGAGYAVETATPSDAGHVAAAASVQSDAGAPKGDAPATVTVKATKGDAKISLSDVKPRKIRCVSGADTTSCTGWPVSTIVASN
ncbi:hypothetical protein [Roseibium suaedae]|uniref:Uncharacterized protein n=1 Tax=Roseibium suaedae TaxID=735517 RepID=A0A1M7D1N5_9HYPH|nr:hypothetical protein [Roseibium suaedae]SHL73287.1 hypothetical protein SAMN05444272_1339 [Roseibium suaedae]